jgi:hypothetical protein
VDPFPAADEAALQALASRADAIRLPPPDLPGWSSLCATEYRVLVAALAAELAALRSALGDAVRAAGTR